MHRPIHVCLVLALSCAGALAQAPLPAGDIPGSKDSPLLRRYAGSVIVSYDRAAFAELSLPLSPLAASDRTDAMNNRVFAPAQVKELEGARTRIAYVVPAERSPLEVIRNYEDEVRAAGGSILFACKREECGGDASRSGGGGGGSTSLLMHFLHERDLKDAYASPGACALTSWIADQRFFAASLPHPDGEAHLAVQTYQVRNENSCRALNGRTVAVIHLVEPKARERRMTTVSAGEMARSIGATGRVALYGILFDFDKALLRPESAPALGEIAALLRADPRLSVLIVGHTDNQGGYDYNVDLSRRRADAVVRALVASHGVEARRLRAAGVGMTAPTASNDDEDGRAKNRRVEVVKLN